MTESDDVMTERRIHVVYGGPIEHGVLLFRRRDAEDPVGENLCEDRGIRVVPSLLKALERKARREDEGV